MLSVPDEERIRDLNDVGISEFPLFARIRRQINHPKSNDVRQETINGLETIPQLQDLSSGAEVAVTAGSRGIDKIDIILRTTIEWLKSQGMCPFILSAMGSHGGATAEGQRKLLSKLGITEKTMNCEIRPSMAVEQIGKGSPGYPIFVAETALAADAILLVNRIKIHTDFVDGDVESGLHKMAVIGLGKQRGAESAHKAATETSFRQVLPKWGAKVMKETPVCGGLAILENGNDATASIHGVPVVNILKEEKRLFKRSMDFFPMLPVEDLDLLIVDEIGKHISGTGIDTNVIGRMNIHGEPEPTSPSITRVYVRSLTKKTDGNGLGIGLADFIHEEAVKALDIDETYINAITGSEPERARIPMTLPNDRTALLAAYSTTGVQSPELMRIARITNTMEPNEILVSAPIANEFEEQPDIDVGPLQPLEFANGNLCGNVGTDDDEE